MRATEGPEDSMIRGEKRGASRGGRGPPIEAYYKGKFRAIHDGGGLGSPGRWKIGCRNAVQTQDSVELAATCKKEFLRWTLEKEKEAGGVKRLFFELAAGMCKESPFKGILDVARREVDVCLKRQGKRLERREGDVAAENNFRRLAAMAEATGDEDFSYLDQVAEKGVILGVGQELPRTPLRVGGGECRGHRSPDP